ncbi:IMS domain-containing protein [Chamaesiphon sp. VAR_48_metabat_135_sub]|uniref:IMS domain-containing protein n=1 Tax=Chamaesiphon sp. VAR_48_metabat_135_sub TaxID=2964699 RepID=UPI00286B19BE|nr:IMS domain-containing protein [Chamaesiphon sp. VAR_48_metabat_135_sub]
MRIPLDYYQILGIPERNLSELEQAYQDRLLQLPRQEYSDAAIESRKRLITVAYQVLSDPQQRAKYSATQASSVFGDVENSAANTNSVPTPFHHRPELDIAPEHFLGGLLILFEQGEYEEINSICMPYLGNNGRSSNSGSLHPHPLSPLTPSGNLHPQLASKVDPLPLAKLKQTASGTHIIPLKPDIVLAMVSSFWELGERESRDSCYEEAVIHYETAKKILVQEDLFPQIQGQIDRRLDRLQPHRISSLVSLPLDRHEQRRQGIQFLEELLESACTNELQCQERFGLNSESTIPFIHETLPHLTAAEQRNLFSQLARESHQLGSKALNVMQLACTYLHVYALIAQGFAYRNPQLIYTAQQILQYRLSQRIDMTIEQSICALLLGQTEEANQMLLTAAESAALVVIRQQSQGLPTLLRGLCWYIESWLKDEAFPCFRDLVTSDPALEAYFNDRDVQDFADRMPATDPSITGWATSSPQLIDVPPSGDLSISGNLQQQNLARQTSTPPILSSSSIGRRPSSLNAVWQPGSDRLGIGNVTPAIRVEPIAPPPPPEPVPTGETETTSNVIQFEQERQRRRSMPTARTIDGEFEQIYLNERPHTAITPTTSSQLVPASKAGQLARSSSGSSTIIRPRRARRKPNLPRILLVATGGATFLWGAGWLVDTAIRGLFRPGATTATISSVPSPPVSNNSTLVKPSSKPASPPPLVGVLTTDVAEQIVTKWLSAKTKSLSNEHQISQLKDILAEPALSSAIERVQTSKVSGVHWQYKHRNIGVASISQSSPQSNVATIQARVTEDAQYYEGDRLRTDRSYSKQLLVQYNLVRQKDGWYIKDMGVVDRL